MHVLLAMNREEGFTIGLWNTEWARPHNRRGRLVSECLAGLGADILCITEGSEDLLPPNGHVITSSPDYGYEAPRHRRKVLLWSTSSWDNTDQVGASSLPPGRFVRGSTRTPAGVIDVIGVCIPWRHAHVRTGLKNRSLWEDHLRYLDGLRDILSSTDDRSMVLGDFNQRIPRKWTPHRVYESLQETFEGWEIPTAGRVGSDGERLIDHIVHRPMFSGSILDVLPKTSSCQTRLSDHVGAHARLAKTTQSPRSAEEFRRLDE